MIEYHKQLIEYIPDVYDYKTVLNIGARPETIGPAFIPNFKECGYEIDLVEIFKKNCDAVKEYFDTIYNIDIRNFKPEKNYDIILWWSGPEHVFKQELPAITDILWKHTEKILIYDVPWGNHPQEPFGGNEDERHLGVYYPEDFPNMERSIRGEKDIVGSDILAWRRK